MRIPQVFTLIPFVIGRSSSFLLSMLDADPVNDDFLAVP